MSDTPVVCPECGFLVGERHQCARRLDTGGLLKSTTDVTIDDITAPITVTVDNTAMERLRARVRERLRRRGDEH